ncbi:MAG TPA: UDP-N-acetylglucosamine 2-epimerase (non-hydrolyzing) [Aeromonadales bacterium]|nr:UDP-N-acetylglucosamine 2-epimerase (non-hydrolyzing) [Aeromonadales bacterium]
MVKIVTIVGARPQFIKASAVSRAISGYNKNQTRNIIKEIIVHTGQHFDQNMSDTFFKELEIPKPDYNLGVSNLSHGAMTGLMLEKIERILKVERPDWVLVYGDTNSTLAGALAASKMNIPIAHVEAGLRSFNKNMPEEINRVVTDHVSTLLLCPTQISVDNLSKEGITHGIYLVGDVMFDSTLYYKEKALKRFKLEKWALKDKQYVLCTIHRAENTDEYSRLESIFSALQSIRSNIDVVLPLHPRTKKIIEIHNKDHWLNGLLTISPLSYLEMMRLEISARVIITDSGGVQKEAFFHQVPCITLREETEWLETVYSGWNKLSEINVDSIINAYNSSQDLVEVVKSNPYGNGNSSLNIINILSGI